MRIAGRRGLVARPEDPQSTTGGSQTLRWATYGEIEEAEQADARRVLLSDAGLA
jgi:hypothetical protein